MLALGIKAIKDKKLVNYENKPNLMLPRNLIDVI